MSVSKVRRPVGTDRSVGLRRTPRRVGIKPPLVGLCLVLVGSVLPSVASASDEDTGVIPATEISVRIQPSSIGATTAAVPSLLRDGSPVGADECDLIEDDSDTSRMLVCTGLADGVYSVVFDGVEPGSFTSSSCSDIVASRAPATELVIGDGFEAWSCQTLVGPPAIRIFDPAEDRLGTELRNEAGDVVSADCGGQGAADDGVPLVSCEPLPFGWYTTAATSFPADTDSPDVVCYPFDSSETLAVNDSPASRGRLELTELHPIWTCFEGLIEPALTFEVVWRPAGDGPPQADWLDSLTFRLVDANDPAVAVVCTITEISDGEAGERFLQGSCPDVPDGEYRLDVDGVPVDLVVQDPCVEVEIYVYEAAYCAVEVSNEALALPEVEIDPSDPVLDGPALPATGSSSGDWLGLGGLLIIAGSSLLRASRRRPARLHPVRV